MKALVKKPKVLLYTPLNINNGLYTKIFEDAKCSVLSLTTSDFYTPVGDLAFGKRDLTPSSYVPNEAFAVFCFCTSAQINQILKALRAPGVPPLNLKAVLTPDNSTWPLRQLYEEIRAEHQLMHTQPSKP